MTTKHTSYDIAAECSNCQHSREHHDIEPPYPCNADCDCAAFTYPTKHAEATGYPQMHQSIPCPSCRGTGEVCRMSCGVCGGYGRYYRSVDYQSVVTPPIKGAIVGLFLTAALVGIVWALGLYL